MTIYDYDSRNRVIYEVNSFGEEKTYTYEGDNYLAKTITYSSGLIETFLYDDAGNKIEESDNKGRKTSYIYDDMNRLIQKTDVYGFSEYYAYDGQGNIINYIDKAGNKITYTYDGNNNQTSVNVNGRTTSKEYDCLGRVISETNEKGLTTTYVYDARGNKVSETDPAGNVTLFEYDNGNHLIKKTYPTGAYETKKYVNDDMIEEIDRFGVRTTYTYDASGHMLSKTRPALEHTIYYEYDNKGNLVKEIDPEENISTKSYDDYGRLVEETTNTGFVTQYVYYEDRNLLKDKVEGTLTTTYAYDVYGNIVSESGGIKGNCTYDYDLLGRMISETGPEENITSYEYDEMGHEIKKIDANGGIHQKTYNKNGELIEEIDPLENRKTYSYHSDTGRLYMVSEGGSSTVYLYDGYGNITQIYIDRRLVVNNTYDNYCRKVKVETPQETISYVYDKNDLITEEHNETTGLITKREYDSYANLVRECMNEEKIKTYAYDSYQNLIEEVDVIGRTTTYEYDQYQRLVKKTSPDKIVTEYQYDNRGNEIREEDNLGNWKTIEYSNKDQVMKTVTNRETCEYAYNSLNQLIKKDVSYGESLEGAFLYEYDYLGNLLKEVDLNGKETRYEYDLNSQKIKEIDALGRETSYQYDYKGRVINVTNAEGNSRKTEYDVFDNILLEVDERGFAVQYEYNDKQQLISLTNKMGAKTTYTYNENNRLQSETDCNNNVKTYMQYDVYGNVLIEKDPNGIVTKYEYTLDDQIALISKNGRIDRNEYDENGRLVKELTLGTDGVVYQRKVNEYDDFGRLIKETNANNQITTYSYNKYGEKIEENVSEHVRKYTYDNKGRLIKEENGTERIIENTYDMMDQLLQTRENERITLENTYDDVGNITQEVKNGIAHQYEYDEMNRKIVEKIENNLLASYEYDACGNQIKIIDPYNNTKTMSYNGNNMLISEIDTNGNETRYEYDGKDQLIKVENALKRVVEYEYDGNGNMLSKQFEVNPERKAVYTYNGQNLVVSETDEYGYTYSYEYDDFGYMTKKIKPDGTEILYKYDLLGNQLKEGNRSFEYDNRNRLKRASVNGYITYFEYDDYDQIIKVTQNNGEVITYEYDKFGNQTKICYDERVINYTYNNNHQILNVEENGKPAADYCYDVKGNVASVVRGTLRSEYRYDNKNRIVYMYTTDNGEPKATYTYAYDGEDNVLFETIDEETKAYTYDEMNELKSVQTTGYNGNTIVTYSYDMLGNRTQSTATERGVEEVTVYSYNKKGQIETISNEIGTVIGRIEYDANGNMDYVYLDGVLSDYQYDEYGQLINLQKGDVTYHYEYDAQGDRIIETANVANVMAGWENIYETVQNEEPSQFAVSEEDVFSKFEEQIKKEEIVVPTSTGNTFTNFKLDKTKENTEVLESGNERYLYGEKERISRQIGDLSPVYYIQNNMKTVYAEIWDGLFRILSYDAFGKTADQSGGGYGHHGEHHDASGLIYLRARYYLPDIGQFIQIDSDKGDSKSIESQNLYNYVRNNPIKNKDPTGHRMEVMEFAGPKNPKPSVKKTSNVYVPIDENGNLINFNSFEKPYAYTHPNSKDLIVTETKETKKVQEIQVEKVEVCPITDILTEYGSGILDAIQFVLDFAGIFGGNAFGTACDILNCLISYVRNDITEFIIGIIGVTLPFVAAGTIRKIAKTEGYEKVIKYVVSQVDDAGKTISGAIRNAGNKVSQAKWIPNKIKNFVDQISKGSADFVEKVFFRIQGKWAQVDEITVTFNYKSKYNKDEFERQLKMQEEKINNLTFEEYVTNRQKYLTDGRGKEEAKIRRKARKDAIAKKTKELVENGIEEKEAEKQAKDWMKTQAILHNPDLCAGGTANSISIGDKYINASIGKQWDYRIDKLDEEIEKIYKKMSKKQKKELNLKIKLVYKNV